MKKLLFICLALAAVMLSGCKENNWMDWKAQNDLWLAQNAKQDSVVTTSTGLQYKIIYQGNPTDSRPDNSKTVLVTYEGYLINGCQFDGGTASFALSSVVSGFAEGLRKINNKGVIEIYVPYYLGYDEEKYTNEEIYEAEGNGTEGTSSYIPPYSVLIFKVNLDAVY